jgi:hypothetical protein
MEDQDSQMDVEEGAFELEE